jgi:hypothetical protein
MTDFLSEPKATFDGDPSQTKTKHPYDAMLTSAKIAARRFLDLKKSDDDFSTLILSTMFSGIEVKFDENGVKDVLSGLTRMDLNQKNDRRSAETISKRLGIMGFKAASRALHDIEKNKTDHDFFMNISVKVGDAIHDYITELVNNRFSAI